MIPHIPYAAVAGFCAFAGSLFGKLSGSDVHLEYVCFRITALWGDFFGKYIREQSSCKEDLVILFIKVFFVMCMVGFNAGVWTFYVKALQASKSSLPATIISSSTNFILSALFGALFFEEATSLLWWSGTILVIIGLVLVNAKNNVLIDMKQK